MPKMASDNTVYHWFVSSLTAWQTGDNLEACLRRVREADGGISSGANVWRVPLPLDASYEINFYAPQVEGAVYCGTSEFPAPRKRRAGR